MKNFKVVFKEHPDQDIGYDDLEVEADGYATCTPGFFDFFKKLKIDPKKPENSACETVCFVSADSVLHITECPK